MDMKSVQVYSTMDYDSLKLIAGKGNRPLDPKRVAAIKASIEKDNLLYAEPIKVNSKHEIVDGQHRYTAARELGVPVYYLYADITPIQISTLADLHRGWTVEERVAYWVAEGREDYIRVRQFADDYARAFGKKFISTNQALTLCHYGDRARMRREFVTGDYRCNDEVWARATVHKILDFQPYIEHWNHGAFINAMQNLCSNAEYDHERMMRKIERLGARLIMCPDVATYISVMNDIYNYQQPHGYRVELRQLGSSATTYRVDRRKKGGE